MRHYLRLSLFFLSCIGSLQAQPVRKKRASPISPRSTETFSLSRPKLVVGLVVDQMRYDYLYRYWNRYGSGGFKRLLGQGFSCENTHINYVPTYTAPGHTAVYSGTTPAVNGIAGNNWYERALGKMMYCVSDSTVKAIGTAPGAKEGKMSPRNLLTTTITDELRLATNGQSRVYGIALKDRGAILPAGHSANGAYWYEGSTGRWISSSWYGDSLPVWLNDFNAQRLPDTYLNKPWHTLYPINTYTQSTADDVVYEEAFTGEAAPVFPHNLPALRGTGYELLREVPFGNTLTRQLAEAVIRGEKLGKGTATDFLTVSFSSTDYIGHRFGTNSIEIEDTYLRLDKELETLLNFLDTWAGRENVLVFLTADHGAAHNSAFVSGADWHIPAGAISEQKLVDTLNVFLKQQFGLEKGVLAFQNQQLYLRRKDDVIFHTLQTDALMELKSFLRALPGVDEVYTEAEISDMGASASGIAQLIKNGYHTQRGGDLYINFLPGWTENFQKGTTHGSGYSYDTHIPLVWYGWGIRSGQSAAPTSITDIAPTLAALLHIQAPNGATGKPIPEVVK